MKKLTLIFGSFLLMIIFTQCYYDKEDILYGEEMCLTENMSYTNDIVPILETHCLTCHNQGSNFGNVTLEGHSNLQIFANNGRLLGAITHMEGFSPMPQGNPQLSSCQIEKISAWITQGTLNN